MSNRSEVTFALISSVKMPAADLSGCLSWSVSSSVAVVLWSREEQVLLEYTTSTRNSLVWWDSRGLSQAFEMCVSEQDAYGSGFNFSLENDWEGMQISGLSRASDKAQRTLLHATDASWPWVFSFTLVFTFLKINRKTEHICRESHGLGLGIHAWWFLFCQF